MDSIINRIKAIRTWWINLFGNFSEMEKICLLVIVAVVVAIFIIYDSNNDDTNVFSSFTRCIRRFIALIVDVASDIISIFSSLTEILNLIRILVFGKVDSQTQIFLANYAVIFMSVVSYFTTMTGLKLVLGDWQAILASFGIQVGILVFAARLSRLIVNKFATDKKKQYVYRLKNNGSCSCDNGQKNCSKVFAKGGTSKNEEDKVNEENKVNEKGFMQGFRKWFGTIAILSLLVICSSFFSYNAFWKKFVSPIMPLSEYVDAQVKISEAEEEYSKSLKEYQQRLEDILYRVNNMILENLDVNPIRLLNARIQNWENDLKDIEDQIKDAERRMSEFEEGSAERNEIEDGELEDYNERKESLEDNIEQAEDQLYSSNIYLVDNALSDLSGFYANPMDEGITLDEVESQWGRLQAALSQIDETKELFTTEQRTNLDIVLNNYLELCRYYRENGTVGFKMKEQDLTGFSGIANSKDEANEKESVNKDEANEKESVNKYEEETKGMLQNAIESLEETPNFAVINAIWDETVIEQPPRTKLLEKMYVAYRDINGEPTEKAIKSLALVFRTSNSPITQRNRGIVVFVLLIALFIDLIIIFISIWKGNKSTNRSFSELRRLVGILFISREKEREKETRRMQLSVAFGLLFGVLMFVVQQLIPSLNKVQDENLYIFFFLYCACSLLAAIIIGKAIGRTQSLVSQDESNKNTGNGIVTNEKGDDKRVIEQYLLTDFIEIFKCIEMKTICIINQETRMLEKEQNVTCIKVDMVQKWKIEFSMLESYKIIFTSEDNKYYILQDIFWKMLYTNILNKMSGNLMLPMSVEDLMNYEDTDEDNS